MKRDGDGYVLSSGRRFYANNGILGLSDEPDAEMTEGYDGRVDEDSARSFGSTRGQFTREERREIAAFMVALWTAWGSR